MDMSRTCKSRPSSAETAIGGSPVRSASSRSEARSWSSGAKSAEMSSPVRSDTALLDSDVPRLLQIVLGVGAKSGERLRALNAGYRREDICYHVRDVVVL